MDFHDARKLQPISVDDYLNGERTARCKHEYAAGMIYAMSDARYAHNLIASRVLSELCVQFKVGPCVALGSNNKVRIDDDFKSWFYYPDVTVVCGDHIIDAVYQDKPTVVVEVLSASTRRIDLGEKKDAYLKLDSLQSYLLFEQECAAAIVFQRTASGFQRLVFDRADAIIPLQEINATPSLTEIYAGVPFTKESQEEYEVTEST